MVLPPDAAEEIPEGIMAKQRQVGVASNDLRSWSLHGRGCLT
jgi:hypothetical protein